MSKLKDFFQNRAVAIALTAAVCLGCVGYGMVGANKPSSVSTDSEYSGIYYVMDEADVLSDKTESAVSDYNFKWDQTYYSVTGLATVNSTDGQSIEDFTYSYGEEWGLGENDMMLVMDVGENQWYFVSSKNEVIPGSAVSEALDGRFAEEFEDGDYNKAVSVLYDELDGSYEKYAAPLGEIGTVHESKRDSGGRISVFGAAVLLAIVISILSAIDRKRYKLWNRRYAGNVLAPAFVPILFWHGVNSSWRRKIDDRLAAETVRTPHRVNPGAYTTYNGARPGDRYKNYNYQGRPSGSRPGSFGGSGYSGGSAGTRSSYGAASGSRASGSRPGSFGGSGFSGGRSSSSSGGFRSSSGSRPSGTRSSTGGFSGNRGGGFGGSGRGGGGGFGRKG